MTATFALPRDGVKFEDCDFYHTIEIPDRGVVRGQWDLREHVDEYLGGYRFAGKRVLEIGPASGFLTFEMERRGADVVALEVPDDPGWDFVPYPDDVLQPIFAPRRQRPDSTQEFILVPASSQWFKGAALLRQFLPYFGDLGTFDVAVMAAVLLHCKRPVEILAECAKRADTLLVTDRYFPNSRVIRYAFWFPVPPTNYGTHGGTSALTFSDNILPCLAFRTPLSACINNFMS